jgi:hypothetical protein
MQKSKAGRNIASPPTHGFSARLQLTILLQLQSPRTYVLEDCVACVDLVPSRFGQGLARDAFDSHGKIGSSLRVLLRWLVLGLLAQVLLMQL